MGTHIAESHLEAWWEIYPRIEGYSFYSIREKQPCSCVTDYGSHSYTSRRFSCSKETFYCKILVWISVLHNSFLVSNHGLRFYLKKLLQHFWWLKWHILLYEFFTNVKYLGLESSSRLNRTYGIILVIS